jgi:hypothetical protein
MCIKLADNIYKEAPSISISYWELSSSPLLTTENEDNNKKIKEII